MVTFVFKEQHIIASEWCHSRFSKASPAWESTRNSSPPVWILQYCNRITTNTQLAAFWKSKNKGATRTRKFRENNERNKNKLTSDYATATITLCYLALSSTTFKALVALTIFNQNAWLNYFVFCNSIIHWRTNELQKQYIIFHQSFIIWKFRRLKVILFSHIFNEKDEQKLSKFSSWFSILLFWTWRKWQV